MHRLPSAWIELELAEWRHHHAEQGGCHDTISCLLHQQSNSNCYRFVRMSLKYFYSSLASAEPTHRCASNAPISPAHARICHKTKASKRNFSLRPPIRSAPQPAAGSKDRDTENGHGVHFRCLIGDSRPDLSHFLLVRPLFCAPPTPTLRRSLSLLLLAHHGRPVLPHLAEDHTISLPSSLPSLASW